MVGVVDELLWKRSSFRVRRSLPGGADRLRGHRIPEELRLLDQPSGTSPRGFLFDSATRSLVQLDFIVRVGVVVRVLPQRVGERYRQLIAARWPGVFRETSDKCARARGLGLKSNTGNPTSRSRASDSVLGSGASIGTTPPYSIHPVCLPPRASSHDSATTRPNESNH